MDYCISVTPYDPTRGVQLMWDDGFAITVRLSHGEVVIEANQAGLLSLARHCVTLAQSTIPSGDHVHLDADGGLEDDSMPLILAKRTF